MSLIDAPEKTAEGKIAPTVSFVSLGCPKALVDSERILTQLRAEGYGITRSHHGADLVIVNTCGFLDQRQGGIARRRSARRWPRTARSSSPAAWAPSPSPIRAASRTSSRSPGRSNMRAWSRPSTRPRRRCTIPFIDLVPPQGLKLTPRHYAYLKISEGCNNRCSFCIIPKLRGDLVSRPAAEVMREAEKLVKAGVKELLVISQDTSAYGVDLQLCREPVAGASRSRRASPTSRGRSASSAPGCGCTTSTPIPHVDEVIPLMAEGKILPYLDIPFQHASPNVLKAMRRPGNQDKALERIRAWREICPDLTLRSTFIVGFPGETDEDFELLLDWLEEAQLDRVGCFQYEPVAGATRQRPRPRRPCRDEVKEQRYKPLHGGAAGDLGAASSRPRSASACRVIIDEAGPTVAKGRSMADAPEIDGAVHVASRRPLRVGRHRHGEGRALRRLRPARGRGIGIAGYSVGRGAKQTRRPGQAGAAALRRTSGPPA